MSTVAFSASGAGCLHEGIYALRLGAGAAKFGGDASTLRRGPNWCGKASLELFLQVVAVSLARCGHVVSGTAFATFVSRRGTGIFSGDKHETDR
jgi:hypothetical protein